jgi:hypothetical protein
VDVDEARRDEQSVRVDLKRSGAGFAADRGDDALVDRDIAMLAGRTGAVDNQSLRMTKSCIVNSRAIVPNDDSGLRHVDRSRDPRQPST